MVRSSQPAKQQGAAVGVIEVAIGPGRGPGWFRVEVVRSAAGEAAAEGALDTGRLHAQRPMLQQALLASSVSARQILTKGERLLRDAGARGQRGAGPHADRPPGEGGGGGVQP